MKEARTTAVVVTFHSRKTIAATLSSARRCHERGLLDCVVVDNASRDGTAEWVRGEHPWVQLIESPENLGFGRACNLAFAHVQTPYLLLLNPDAQLEPDSLERLVDFLDSHPEAGIAGPAMRAPGGRVQFAGNIHTPWTILRSAAGRPQRGSGREPITPGRAAFRTDWLCGAVMLIRSQLFAQLEGFDPRFFLYFEETDLCRRAIERGAELWAVGEAVAFHAPATSAASVGAPMYGNCIAEHYFRSRFYFLAKHHGWLGAVAVELSEFVVLVVRGAGAYCLGRSDGALRERLKGPLLGLPSKVGASRAAVLGRG